MQDVLATSLLSAKYGFLPSDVVARKETVKLTGQACSLYGRQPVFLFLKKKILAASETSPDVFLCHKYGSYLMASGLPIYRFTPFGYFRRKCVNTVDPPRCKMNETCISMGEHSRYALP